MSALCVGVWFSAEEASLLRQRAALAGLSLSDYIRCNSLLEQERRRHPLAICTPLCGCKENS